MGQEKELQLALKKFITKEPQTFIAKVLKVDKQQKTIIVEDADGLDFDNVRLTSVIDHGNKVVQYPKVQTSVLVSRIGDDDNTLFVSALSEVESIEGVIDSTEFLINKDGYRIEREGQNLKAAFDKWQEQFGKLCDEINKIVVSVGTSPNIAAIKKIKQTVTEQVKDELDKVLI